MRPADLPAVTAPLGRGDEWLSARLARLPAGRWMVAARALSTLGNAPVAGAMVWAATTRHGRPARRPLVVLATGVAVQRLAAAVVDRRRPPRDRWRVRPGGPSMPSGHAATAALAAGLVAPDSPAGYPVAAAIGASRVLLGVHWPSDVLAGLVYAAAWARLTRPIARHPE
ncbi:MAG: phosphatase PAP2 family protein [Mycobacteriales bacterium]